MSIATEMRDGEEAVSQMIDDEQDADEGASNADGARKVAISGDEEKEVTVAFDDLQKRWDLMRKRREAIDSVHPHAALFLRSGTHMNWAVMEASARTEMVRYMRCLNLALAFGPCDATDVVEDEDFFFFARVQPHGWNEHTFYTDEAKEMSEDGESAGASQGVVVKETDVVRAALERLPRSCREPVSVWADLSAAADVSVAAGASAVSAFFDNDGQTGRFAALLKTAPPRTHVGRYIIFPSTRRCWELELGCHPISYDPVTRVRKVHDEHIVYAFAVETLTMFADQDGVMWECDHTGNTSAWHSVPRVDVSLGMTAFEFAFGQDIIDGAPPTLLQFCDGVVYGSFTVLLPPLKRTDVPMSGVFDVYPPMVVERSTTMRMARPDDRNEEQAVAEILAAGDTLTEFGIEEVDSKAEREKQAAARKAAAEAGSQDIDEDDYDADEEILEAEEQQTERTAAAAALYTRFAPRDFGWRVLRAIDVDYTPERRQSIFKQIAEYPATDDVFAVSRRHAFIRSNSVMSSGRLALVSLLTDDRVPATFGLRKHSDAIEWDEALQTRKAHAAAASCDITLPRSPSAVFETPSQLERLRTLATVTAGSLGRYSTHTVVRVFDTMGTAFRYLPFNYVIPVLRPPGTNKKKDVVACAVHRSQWTFHGRTPRYEQVSLRHPRHAVKRFFWSAASAGDAEPRRYIHACAEGGDDTAALFEWPIGDVDKDAAQLKAKTFATDATGTRMTGKPGTVSWMLGTVVVRVPANAIPVTRITDWLPFGLDDFATVERGLGDQDDRVVTKGWTMRVGKDTLLLASFYGTKMLLIGTPETPTAAKADQRRSLALALLGGDGQCLYTTALRESSYTPMHLLIEENRHYDSSAEDAEVFMQSDNARYWKRVGLLTDEMGASAIPENLPEFGRHVEPPINPKIEGGESKLPMDAHETARYQLELKFVRFCITALPESRGYNPPDHDALRAIEMTRAGWGPRGGDNTPAYFEVCTKVVRFVQLHQSKNRETALLYVGASVPWAMFVVRMLFGENIQHQKIMESATDATCHRLRAMYHGDDKELGGMASVHAHELDVGGAAIAKIEESCSIGDLFTVLGPDEGIKWPADKPSPVVYVIQHGELDVHERELIDKKHTYSMLYVFDEKTEKFEVVNGTQRDDQPAVDQVAVPQVKSNRKPVAAAPK